MNSKRFLIPVALFYWGLVSFVPVWNSNDSISYEALERALNEEQDSLMLDIKFWPCGIACDEANVSIMEVVEKFLHQNPDNTYQVETYTDCRGGDNENVKLSLERSEMIRDWLVKKGITKERVVAKGFGGRRPIEPCVCSECTPLQHVANRRVVLRLINIFSPEGLKERVVLEQPWLKKQDHFKGVVAIRTCVGKNGKVESVKLDEEETTATNKDYVQRVLETTKDWRFTRSPKQIQCGMIRYDFGL